MNRSQNKNKKKVVRKQPRKDNQSKRVNYDNTRESKFEEDMRKDAGCRDKSNDVSWYAKNPDMFRAAGSIGFVNVAGKEMPWTSARAVPGVMTLQWVPSLGGGDQTAVNQAANSIYSFVVHANSRNQSYDAPDLMMMILAGANLFHVISHGLRAYGTMRRFDGLNQYTPKALVSAMGFNYSDLQSNLANMWFDLNHLIAQTNQIWIPNDIPLIERWYWMNNNIYMDGNSVKAQYYLYVPDMVYQLSETGSEEGTSLIPAPRPDDPTTDTSFCRGALWTWSEYKQLVQQLIDALIGSQDRGIIMGDILKAYGLDHIYALSPITSEYVTEPVYNQEVLTQIENLIEWPYLPAAITQSQVTRQIRQNFTDVSFQMPTDDDWLDVVKAIVPSVGVLNFHFPGQPTPEQIMVATRMMILGTAVDSVNGNPAAIGDIYPAYTGSEYCTGVVIWQYDYSQGTPVPVLTHVSRNGQASNTEETVGSTTYHICGLNMPYSGKPTWMDRWAAFDWCPAVYFNSVADTTSPNILANEMKNSKPYNVILDYDNYSIVSVNELRKLHVAALLSEFGVPKI